MRFSSLGSGSKGNGLIIEEQKTRLLLDCGFSLKEVTARLFRLGLEPSMLDGIIITHEHSDHIGGVERLARKFDIPIWLTHGTLRGAKKSFSSLPSVNIIDSHQSFSIGDICIQPYPVPHDAQEPTQFIFDNGAFKLGVLTDTGCSTLHIETVLSRCHALVLECNHDAQLLASSNYPKNLKERIGGRLGHLDNIESAKILSKLDCSLLQHIIAAHLSQKNNTPLLAKTALSSVLNCSSEWVGIADQNKGFDWRQIV
ncbi:MAG: MBL fold metallo-hydrolase [Nitrosomonadaceae bacterium]|nr:MBL fold metallo-hydrolase [Nitrosomonadaceae bacterium]|tara:strand:+ start:1486 stop:2253 length:768 start_codon:yes stop_codon:yes gene_type:complete